MFLLHFFTNLPRPYKRVFSVVADVLGLILAGFLAVWIRLGEFGAPLGDFETAIWLLPLIAIPVFIVNGLYRAIIRYIGQKFMWTVLISVSIVFVLWTAAIFMLDLRFPRSAIIITWLLTLVYILGTRGGIRLALSNYLQNLKSADVRRVVIYGAGPSGKQLLDAIGRMPSIRVVAFIDEDLSLQKHEIASIKIYPPSSLAELISDKKVHEVFLASTHDSHKDRKRLIDWLEPFPVKVFSLPTIDEIVSGKVSFSDLREVNIDDILGRDAVSPKPELLSKCIKGKTVMVTGAGGSIGSELCRKVVKQSPQMLILFELSEFALYQIFHELNHLETAQKIEIIPIIGDVKNRQKLSKLFSQYDVDTVYHAAAYKHVPLVEHNIAEGIHNNAFGTFALAEVAAQNQVDNFVLISTDKAVRPTNFMGASKRLAEISLQALQDEYKQTCFTMVRFGNVLGSSGSVIPLFRKQIAMGGPVTVTHPEITRFFMTIPEAASLVIQAGSMGKGGDVFLLDMGEPIKIDELARKMIHLSGREVFDENGNGDIQIAYTGLRPGEKLYEELLITENVQGTNHPKIMRANEAYMSLNELKHHLALIERYLSDGNYHELASLLEKLVAGFKHNHKFVDVLLSKSNSVNIA